MKHFMMDAFNGNRLRLDNMKLVYELLEKLPPKLGLKAVMPPFILPYYDGAYPEDCGISAFVFLSGGHITIHTFSFREVYFVDLVSYDSFDDTILKNTIIETLPADKVNSKIIERERVHDYPRNSINCEMDFGPHLFLDFENYTGPNTLDDLFKLFDTMPYEIGMTPIIRPYVVKSTLPSGEEVTSILTMIAESHISLHYFKNVNRAYLDLFSCRIFDYENVIKKLKSVFGGDVIAENLLSRGSKYQKYIKMEKKGICCNSWIDNVYR